MRPFESIISFEEAQRRLRDAVVPIARSERIALETASGRVASSDVGSPMDVPPFARSAMDGYAVVSADTMGASTASPARLRIVERIYTGQTPRSTISRGTCAEIATGAPLPEGADAVVMVEQTVPGGDAPAGGGNRHAFGACDRRHRGVEPPPRFFKRDGGCKRAHWL